MNSRTFCTECNRVESVCICKFRATYENNTPVTILRHPSERRQEKATADLLRLSISNCRIIDSEIFNSTEVLKAEYKNILIYPSDSSSLLTKDFITHNNSKIHIILIDGTWKKAYKIFMSNNFLQDLDTFSLDLNRESIYKDIRKQKTNGLSTFEAATEVLSLLDNSFPLNDFDNSLKGFLDHLKSFRS